MAANITTILAKIRQNVIDLPSATTGRLEEWVQEAQVNSEDEYQFLWMRKALSTQTEAGNVNLFHEGLPNLVKPLDWIRAIGDPYYFTGGGVAKRMEWSPSRQDFDDEFPNSSLETDRGSPRTLFEKDTNISIGPIPDQGNVLGLLSTFGDYFIRTNYYQREPTLVVGSVQTNRFTSDPNLALYLEDYASGQAQLFNHDYDNGQVSLLKAERHFQRAKRTDKRSRAQFMRLTPRRDSHASRHQRRAV